MPTYAGVTFKVVLEPQDFRPVWTRQANISVRNIPYANKDNVQSAGQGNFRMTVTAVIAADADLATLQAAVGVTGRTLTDLFETNYNNTYLLAVDNPRRQTARQYIWADLTFMREGS